MSKALKPYVPRPNYAQIIQQRFFDYSFMAQKNDMKLRDCTDMLGWLKLPTLFPKGLNIQAPYIFKVSKIVAEVEKSFFVVGTMHILPLGIYPELLREMLFRQPVLVTESQSFESLPLQEYEEEAKDPDINEQKSLEMADWFEDLSDRVRHWLADIIGDSLDFQAQPEHADVALHALMVHNGMDYNLINEYKAQGRTVLGLENDADVVEAITESGEAETRYEIICGLIEAAEDSLVSGGLFAHHDPVSEIKSHLLDKDLDSLKYTPSVHKRNEKWMPRLLGILDKYPTEILLAVGLGHLFGNGGILTIMSEDNWNISRADLVGMFDNFDPHELLG